MRARYWSESQFKYFDVHTIDFERGSFNIEAGGQHIYGLERLEWSSTCLDINGKEIYAGDIDSRGWLVEFSDGCFTIGGYTLNRVSGVDIVTNSKTKNLEVKRAFNRNRYIGLKTIRIPTKYNGMLEVAIKCSNCKNGGAGNSKCKTCDFHSNFEYK